MTDYFQTLVIGDYPQTAKEFVQTAAVARLAGQPATARLISETFVAMEAELVAMSERTAEIADAAIKDKIASTAVRAVETGDEPGGGLLEHIQSHPIAANAGIVGIAQIGGTGGLDELAYWRAQNYGLSTQNFLGRKISGFFYDNPQGANPLVPQQGVGDQPIFRPGRGGIGIIRNPIEERRFLEAGATAAAAYWQRERVAVVKRAVRRLSAALAQSARP